jgi:hypothetical protein
MTSPSNKIFFSRTLLIVLSVFVSSSLPFISTINKFIGEPFDARFQIVVHEHWFWVLNGERPLRDVFIFYPFDKTLGFSDIFFANGIIYSLLRFLSIDILDAWTITNLLIILIGNIGLAFLLTHILKNTLFIVLAIFTLSNSYAFVALLNIWPNSAGYMLVTWVLFFLYKIYSTNNKITFWLNCLLIYVPLLSLSFWYPGFFSIIGSLLFIFLLIIKQRGILLQKVRILAKKRSLNNLALVSPVWIGLWILFIYIVIPTSNNLRRAKDEIYRGSLDASNFFATDLVGPTYLSKALEYFTDVNLFSGDQEWAIGYPLLAVILFILISIKNRKRIASLDNLESFTFFAIIISIFFTTRLGEYGLYIFLWQSFEFFGIIRTPIRINILTTFLLLLFIFNYLDKISVNANIKHKILFLFIALALGVDQFRILPPAWNEKMFINQDLLKQANQVKKNCEYFVLVNEGAGHWSDTMDGMVLSALINIPTINGYSGTFPSDAIQRRWYDPSEYSLAFDYINRNDLNNNGCFVNNNYVSKLSKLTPFYIFDNYTNFYWESTRNKSWKWIEVENFTFEIRNPYSKQPLSTNEIFFNLAPCQKSLSLEVLVNGVSRTLNINKENTPLPLYFPVIPPNESLFVNIKSSQVGCTVDSDPRPLIYALEIINE